MPVRAGWLLGIAAAIAVAAGGLLSVRGRLDRRAARALDADADPRRWPGDEAVLAPVRAAFPPDARVIKLALDPGHGAPNNHGNTSSYCVAEQDAMLVLAEELAARLEETAVMAR